jgi:hypothetical protein
MDGKLSLEGIVLDLHFILAEESWWSEKRQNEEPYSINMETDFSSFRLLHFILQSLYLSLETIHLAVMTLGEANWRNKARNIKRTLTWVCSAINAAKFSWDTPPDRVDIVPSCSADIQCSEKQGRDGSGLDVSNVGTSTVMVIPRNLQYFSYRPLPIPSRSHCYLI